jgi:hypothetical protein
MNVPVALGLAGAIPFVALAAPLAPALGGYVLASFACLLLLTRADAPETNLPLHFGAARAAALHARACRLGMFRRRR